MKSFINKCLGLLGYHIQRIRPEEEVDESNPRFVLYQYLKDDGSFDYEEYKRIQETANITKIDKIWVTEDDIRFLSTYIKDNLSTPSFGLCHGTRNGKEQQWFRNYLSCEVIGTEISKTAEQFPHTIQWDFHEVKPEWLNTIDFIYSNAFDHSYDPEKCLNAWMSCLKKDGLCIIEHSSINEHVNDSPSDPFGADIFTLLFLIARWSKGKYGVKQLLEAPLKREGMKYNFFVVLQRFD